MAQVLKIKPSDTLPAGTAIDITFPKGYFQVFLRCENALIQKFNLIEICFKNNNDCIQKSAYCDMLAAQIKNELIVQ